MLGQLGGADVRVGNVGDPRAVHESDVRPRHGNVHRRVRARPDPPDCLWELRDQRADVQRERRLARRDVHRSRMRSDHDPIVQRVRDADVQFELRVGRLLVPIDAGVRAERDPVFG